MIIRVTEELLKALYPETPLIANETPESAEAARLAPGWFRDALFAGQNRLVVVSKEDFYQLPYEVSQFCDILSQGD